MSETSIETRLNSISRETLTPLVSNALGGKHVEIIDWQYEAIHGGTGVIFGDSLYRFLGRARVLDQTRQWMLILKTIRADPEITIDNPSTWDYWKREALALQVIA